MVKRLFTTDNAREARDEEQKGIPVKIALVSPYDWSYPGGVRSHIEYLARELRQHGHSVRILTPASGPQAREVEFGVFKLGWTASLHFNGSVARVGITPAISRQIRRLLQREAFDIIHLHEPFVSTLTLAVLRVASDAGIPCVATFHASTNRKTSTATMAYSMASPFLGSLFKRLDGCIAVSEAAQAHVSRFFSGDFTIIPNGIDVTRFDGSAPHLPQFTGTHRNVLFLSRMEPRKGLRFLLKAIPLIRESYPGPVRFILAGDGPQRAQFEHFVGRKGWEDVIFTGYVSDADKPSYFATADIYCAPNTGNESQGIVLLEAMASGTPVVASDIPGFRSVITDSAMGVLAAPRDAERLAWAICHLLRDESARRGVADRGQQRAQDFGWDRVTTSIEGVYHEAQRRLHERQGDQWRWRPSLRKPFAMAPLTPREGQSVWAISSLEENVVE